MAAKPHGLKLEQLRLGDQVLLELLSAGDDVPDVVSNETIDRICDRLGANSLYHAVSIYAKTREDFLQHRTKIANAMERRLRVMARTNFCCAYCGRDFLASAYAFADASIDHIEAKACGGSNDLNNLAAACHGCNRIKGNVYTRTLEDAREAVERQVSQFELPLRQARNIREQLNQQNAPDDCQLVQLDTSILTCELSVA